MTREMARFGNHLSPARGAAPTEANLTARAPADVVLYVVGGSSIRNPAARDFPLLVRRKGESKRAHLQRVTELVEAAMAAGGTHLLVPREQADWLGDHPLVAAYLAERHEMVDASPGTGIVFALRPWNAVASERARSSERHAQQPHIPVAANGVLDGIPSSGEVNSTEVRSTGVPSQHSWSVTQSESTVPSWRAEFERFLEICELRLGRPPFVLDWRTGAQLSHLFGAHDVDSLQMVDEETLPYLSRSFDVVAVSCPSRAQLEEARRVALLAVIELPGLRNAPLQDPTSTMSLSHEWVEGSPEFSIPSTSIIIPSFNSKRLLEGCLSTLRNTLSEELPVQIIVVDDASLDGTWDMLNRIAKQDGRVIPVRNETNMGFPDSCNRGAANASGNVLFFLNADTEPQRGWLPPLLRRFSDPTVGAVGSKLIYPDGTLQEAGCVIFRDATGANFGKGCDPDDPLFCYAREVDYCSGAALAVSRPLFERIRGFDPLYRPAYYEDTDLCMRVWQAGFKVLVEPESRIVHLEGSVHGTDPSQGGKRYQVQNHEKFLKRWSEGLAGYPSPPPDYSLAVWHDLAVRQPRMMERS